MTRPGVFLTAEWRNLVLLSYAVDPALLLPFVPPGTELDAFQGSAFASLVGFEFNKTRVLGLSIPFHRCFEEVNLRFYVRRGSRRGVVFIRELVPRFAIAAVARTCFGERYSSVRMAHRIRSQVERGGVETEYSWGRTGQECSIRIETQGPGFPAPEGSLAQFITEHYWGYAAQRDGGCVEYEVEHPRWIVREASHATFQGDGATYYGAELARLFQRPPDSAFLAEGSAVTVYRGARLR